MASWPPLARYSNESTKLNPIKQELDAKTHELEVKTHELDAKKHELPMELQEKIAKQGGKGDRDDLIELVLEILAIGPMTNAELAGHLGRNPPYVRRTFLRPQLAVGRIQSSNPENPTDPKLKYSVVRDSDATS